MVELLGIDFVYPVVAVTLRPTASSPADVQVAVVGQCHGYTTMPWVHHIVIWPGGVDEKGNLSNEALGELSDEGAHSLLMNSNLQSVSLTSARLSDVMVRRILSDAKFKSIGISRHSQFGSDIPAVAVMDSNKKLRTSMSKQFSDCDCPSRFDRRK